MKKNAKKRTFAQSNGRKGKDLSIDKDPFFSADTKKKLKRKGGDEEILSDESDDDNGSLDSDRDEGRGVEGNEGQFEDETADEKRRRVAMEYLAKIQEIARRKKEEDGEDVDEDDDLSGRRSGKDGERDSLVAQMLQQEQLEDSGRVRRAIASRVQKPEAADEFRVLVKHRQSVTAVTLSDDDMKGFSASKDGTILHWDIDVGKRERYSWPSDEKLRSHGLKDPLGRARKQSKHILTLAVSSDGRYLATGGVDRHVHIWDTRTREHIQTFPGHRGPVSCLTFRQGTSELFSGSYDRTVKIWNVGDRSYINTLFGHQSEILTIDCLRKERVLTVGRDRTMQLFKVPEESRLVFRAPASSLECSCFIGNDEFLSGSDDGSIELWSIQKKKPVYIARNAHTLSSMSRKLEEKESGGILNDYLENGDTNLALNTKTSAYSWVGSVAVCRSSDLGASGAGNGSICLWAIEHESKNVLPIYNIPLVGFVNSLAFAKSGEFLVAGVGQEPRLGRWGRIPAAQNGVAIHRIKLS